MTFFSLLSFFELRTHLLFDFNEETTKLFCKNALEKVCSRYVCKLSIL